MKILLLLLFVCAAASQVIYDRSDGVNALDNRHELAYLAKSKRLLVDGLQRVVELLINANSQEERDRYSAMYLALHVQLDNVKDEVARVTGQRRFEDVLL